MTILCMLGLGTACGTGNASYLAPSPSNFKPFSKPAPFDRWSTDCEVRCGDDSLRKAHVSILRWQGEPPDPDGCSQVSDGDLQRTCESSDKGACLRCEPWKAVPEIP
jgi:hypothetical protein